MLKLSNKEIRNRISKLHSKKENLIGRKEELLKTYMEVCENTDYKDLIELDKQILQEKITTNEEHMIDLIRTIENVVSKIEGA
jgi:RNase P subunit RPR2|tara:strand:+ start:184 stop:432 length:249 start_codon:yes stop_codon:yes gene_type:complete